MACQVMRQQLSSLSVISMIENASVVWEFLKGRKLPGVVALDRVCFNNSSSSCHYLTIGGMKIVFSQNVLLKKLSYMPLTTWSYMASSVRNLGSLYMIQVSWGYFGQLNCILCDEKAQLSNPSLEMLGVESCQSMLVVFLKQLYSCCLTDKFLIWQIGCKKLFCLHVNFNCSNNINSSVYALTYVIGSGFRVSFFKLGLLGWWGMDIFTWSLVFVVLGCTSFSISPFFPLGRGTLLIKIYLTYIPTKKHLPKTKYAPCPMPWSWFT